MTFRLLCRGFFDQFYAGESTASEMRLRQAVMWMVAFLIAPGVILLLELLPRYQWVLIRATRFHDQALLDDTLEWTALLFITHSMATIGPGCGGTNPCAADSPANSGIARCRNGKSDLARTT